jgi:molybdopterin-dependent oxidoreductase-like protein protein
MDKPDLVERRRKFIDRQISLHKDSVNVRFHGQRPEGSGRVNRHGMPQLPVGQHEVKNWPVLDLGEMPDVDAGTWKLEVGGLVENPFTLTWNELLALPQVDDVSDFHCVTAWSRYNNHWRGVQFRTIAELAVPKEEARFVLCTGSDFAPGTFIPLHDQPSACAGDRGRRPARSHVGGPAAAARARRPGADDHAQAVRLEGNEMDSQDRVPRGRSERLLGSARIFQFCGTMV